MNTFLFAHKFFKPCSLKSTTRTITSDTVIASWVGLHKYRNRKAFRSLQTQKWKLYERKATTRPHFESNKSLKCLSILAFLNRKYQIFLCDQDR